MMRQRRKDGAAPEGGFARKEAKPDLLEKQEAAGRMLRAEDFGGGPQAVRIMNALDYAGVHTVPELLAKSDSEILKMRSMGRKGLERVKSFREQLAKASGGIIAVREDGSIFTNLSREQLLTIFRIAKLELSELRETVVPEKVKVIGELLGMVVVGEKG